MLVFVFWFMGRTILEDEDGYGFETVMMDVFRNLGYSNVRNPSMSDDMGRDIIMEKNGVTYIVECKHFSDTKVGRPIVQKLDSAARSFETDNEKQGMVVTTNNFSQRARDYAEKVGVELWDGEKISSIAEEAGLDIYNGNVEIVCDKSVPFSTDEEGLKQEVLEEFEKVENFREEFVQGHEFHVELIPVLHIESDIFSVYESSSVGVVDKIRSSHRHFERLDGHSSDIDVIERLHTETEKFITINEEELSQTYHSVEFKRFNVSESSYREKHAEEVAKKYERKVEYTAGNNNTYTKTHSPTSKDVDITHFQPVYIPKIKVETQVKDYSYNLEYFTNNKNKEKIHNETVKDVKTGKDLRKPTMCFYCGSINKKRKVKTERLENKPICPHCSTKERFALRKRYFKDEDNLQQFKHIYSQMNKLQQLSENTIAATILISTTLIAFSATIALYTPFL